MNQFGFDLSTKEGRSAYNKAWRKKNYAPSERKNQFGFDQKTREGRIAYSKAYRAKYRDPAKESERSIKWRYGKGREAYLNSKKNYVKNNRDAVNELQRRVYARNYFKGVDVPKELIEAKYLQLMIERELRNEKCI
jgi:NAD(P)H-nitrite reductase large subunit